MTRTDRRQADLANDYVERLSDWAELSTKPLFGAISLRRNDLVFAMVWQGALYFKVDESSRPAYEKAGSHALPYVREGHEKSLKSYWQAPAEVVEDDDVLQQWAERAWQAALDSHR